MGMQIVSMEKLALIPVIAALCLARGSADAAPAAKAKQPARAAPRPSAAFSPDGKWLAVGGYREVLLLAVGAPGQRRTLPVPAGAVTCVAFSPDGFRIAAAGGVPGKSGEIRVYDLDAARASAPVQKHCLGAGIHSDVVFSVAWSPDGKTLAAGSYDRLASLWDVESGQGRRLKDHTDAVYAVAYSPDGKQVASASGDRTVKVWDVVSGKRVYTLSDSTAELYTVAFHPAGTQIAAGGADRLLRKWDVTAGSGTLARSAFAHDRAILRIVYTPDGNGVYTSSEDGAVKLWDGTTLSEEKVFARQSDWPLGLALSRDGKLLAVSRYDGSVNIYDTATGIARLVVRS